MRIGYLSILAALALAACGSDVPAPDAPQAETTSRTEAGDAMAVMGPELRILAFGNSLFAVSWQDKDGATVANIQDFDRQVVYSLATMPDGRLMRMIGAIDITSPSTVPQDDRPGRNRSRALHSAPMKSRTFADAPERQNDWRTRHG